MQTIPGSAKSSAWYELTDMKKKRSWLIPTLGQRALLYVIFFAFACSLRAQTIEPRSQNPSEPEAATSSDYRIGPGDVLVVNVIDAPEFGGKFRVSDSGVIDFAGISAPLKAEGQTTIELAHTISQALIDAKQLLNPKVTVFIDEYHGRTVTVMGNVSKPGVYSLERKTTVVEALSLAGGLLPNAGNTVTIVRGAASAEASGTPVGSV
jgi:protein involved in polysaccharide export with SLBB domain